MAEYTALAPLFTDIANAIRSKTGETGAITASSFPQEINNISSGGLKLIATCTIVSGSYSYNNQTPINLSAWSGLKPLICECKAIGDVVVSVQTQISFAPTYSYGRSLVELPKNQTFPSGITSHQILYPVTTA